jgi:hypothetical protein
MTHTGSDILTALYAKLAASSTIAQQLDGAIKFLLHGEGGGVWILTGGEKPGLQAGPGDADCTIECSVETLSLLASGSESAQVAYVKNDLQVSGESQLLIDLVHLWGVTLPAAGDADHSI